MEKIVRITDSKIGGGGMGTYYSILSTFLHV